jgi:dephospho-CoA kinase
MKRGTKRGLTPPHPLFNLTVSLAKARLDRMKIIGLTGGIGTGKSTVAGFLRELGATVIDVDKVWHETLQPDTQVGEEVVAAFGKGILTPEGGIDRKKLGEIVFANPEALARLNNIMHPWMYDAVKARLKGYRRQGVKVVVLEAPLLIDVPTSMNPGEPSLLDEVNEVWVTAAPEPVVLKRMKEKSDLPEEQTLARIRSQLSPEERLKHADVVIDTDCSLDELKQRVGAFWDELDT